MHSVDIGLPLWNSRLLQILENTGEKSELFECNKRCHKSVSNKIGGSEEVGIWTQIYERSAKHGVKQMMYNFFLCFVKIYK